MKALLNSSKALVAAFAVSVGLGGAAAAQDNVTGNDVEVTNISLQEEISSLTSEEALERSNGQIILHYGQNYDEWALRSNIESLERMGFTVSAYSGGPDNQTNVYFFALAASSSSPAPPASLARFPFALFLITTPHSTW